MKVLILSATTGGGHMTAANALKDYIMEQNPDSVVEILDALQYCSPFINKAVTGGYVYMAKNTPKMYGSIYKNADKSSTTVNKTVEITTSILKTKLIPVIERLQPDIIVCTHAFGAEMSTGLKADGVINIPIISIVTDFAVHQAYISSGVDAYIVSSHEMVEQFSQRNVDTEKVYPLGIPVKQAFYQPIDRKQVFEDEGLDPDIPTILIMAGSFGVTDILKVYHKIVKSPEDFQIIVITGKNEKLYETFDNYLRKITINNTLVAVEELTHPQNTAVIAKKKKPAKPTKLLYFTNEVPKYMHMADLIVTKPGGLTVSEAIASDLPMAIFKAIPGQEEQNAEFLQMKNMAVRIEKDNSCTDTITSLLREPERLAVMKESINRFCKGNSAANVYGVMVKLLEQYHKAP